jgi:hypothetical protein
MPTSTACCVSGGLQLRHIPFLQLCCVVCRDRAEVAHNAASTRCALTVLLQQCKKGCQCQLQATNHAQLYCEHSHDNTTHVPVY